MVATLTQRKVTGYRDSRAESLALLGYSPLAPVTAGPARPASQEGASRGPAVPEAHYDILIWAGRQPRRRSHGTGLATGTGSLSAAAARKYGKSLPGPAPK